MEEALKSLNTGAKVLARNNNATWDIQLQTEDAANSLADSILMTKMVRLQTEYMGARKGKVTLHGVLFNIYEDHLGFSSHNLGRLRM